MGGLQLTGRRRETDVEPEVLGDETDEAEAVNQETEPAEHLQLPTRPFEQMLWVAFVAGAGWADGEFPEPDDEGYWLSDEGGRSALGTFTALVESLKPPEQPKSTLCPLGRPYRQHLRRCSPECDWSAS